VPTAKKSAKSLSNPGKTVQCIAGSVFPSTKIAAVKKRRFCNPLLLRRILGLFLLLFKPRTAAGFAAAALGCAV